MAGRARGSVYKRCGCRDAATGKRKGPACALLRQTGHGSWYLTLEFPAGLNGERGRLRLGGHRSRRQAESALRVLQGPSARAGTTSWTTGRWLRHWLVGRLSLRPNTRRMYDSHLRLYLVPHLDRIPLAALTSGDLRGMFQTIIRQHRTAGRPLTPGTLHSIRCTVRAALNAAVREGLLTDNPARWVELPAHPRPKAVVWTPARVAAWQAGGTRPPIAVWTPADTARFLAAIEDDKLHSLLYLVALRGLRRGEAAGLCWPDVDLDDGTLTIARTLQEHHGRPVLLPPKTAASARTLALDRSTVAVLTTHRHAQRRAAGVDRPDGFVFAHPDGRPYSPSHLSHHFQKLQQQHGMPPIRFHDLRHGAATLALAAGADLKAIQDMLGHAIIVLTADTYTSVLPEVARSTAEGIAKLVLDAGRNPPGRPDGPPRRPSAASRQPARRASRARTRKRAGLTTGSPRPHHSAGDHAEHDKRPGQ
jgi:integrase